MTLNKVILRYSYSKYSHICPKDISKLNRRSFSSFVKCSSAPSSAITPFNKQSVNEKYSNNIIVRFYGNVGKDWLPKRNQYTKYRITKPWTSDSVYDDIFLSEPSKDDFYPFTKEMPVFLKFLNLLTTAQNRKEVFVNFVRRCENGLVVEKDVYITKEELLDCMWANGYSESELNAFRFAFPNDYKFHYPELAVLFELEEEDCYKYCLKERASNPEQLVELKLKKPSNLVSSYGLVFLGCWFALSNAVLGNAWFFAKTLPFGAVFYLLASYFQKWLKEYFWKEENALIEKLRQEKDYCEEAIYAQLRNYLEDSKCAEYVEGFKSEVTKKMEEYKRALLLKMKSEATNLMKERLNSMALQESAISSSLEKTMVTELVKLFLETFKTSSEMKTEALLSSVNELKGEYSKKDDPLFNFFNTSLEQFQSNKSNNSFVKRCNDVFKQKEQEFLNTYTVTTDEYKEVSKLAKLCKSNKGFNVNKLKEEDRSKLEQLYLSLSQKMGYYVPVLPLVESQYKDPLVDKQLTEQLSMVRESRLQEFLRQFA
ncbi:conserved hypothetical protein [Theileria orientalis strain Shintoku]|uniref:Uncharacterized protein n=1 Tax=Theileria orientalis strain Shintoku TaxID=869250 RepID=J4DNS6_THEOR|nr:conserved hypothetical protein [Theileria orientalis strain Shintoku]PVC53999.1 hypothetical protein MACL_00003368 [Theileria orientalis]BAM39474.1 conserved hypothetical protein [Theileria orientalis strain Shintoku]|eukprot:XP_009689775.1 conserved hypothetical protein [Theileria orientalis strain Shintoku]